MSVIENDDEEEEICGAEMMHRELLATINRFRLEADLSVCEILGVLRLIEEDVIESAKPES